MAIKKKMKTGGITTVRKNKKGLTTKTTTSGGTLAVLKHKNNKGETTKYPGDEKSAVTYEKYGKGITTVVKNKTNNKKEISYQSANPNKPIYKKTVSIKKK